MSGLRRRIFGGTPDESDLDSSRDVSPAPGHSSLSSMLSPNDRTDYAVVPAKKLKQLTKDTKKGKGSKRRNFWIFGLGGLFGLVLAGFFASSNGALDKLVTLAGLENMNLDSLLDVLPAGLIRDVQDLQVSHISYRTRTPTALMLTKVSLFAVS